MAVDVSEATFEQEVVERSRRVPVVVDFWAEWCGPCRTLTPALEAAEAARNGKVVLAKVDVDANQVLAARFGVQGIPAVKAFRDGAIAGEFVGAVPKARVEELFDSLVPSRADELLAAGDELSLREAAELAPGRADIAVALARKRLERGAEDDALAAVEDTKVTSLQRASSPASPSPRPASPPRPSKPSIVASKRQPSKRSSAPWKSEKQRPMTRSRRARVSSSVAP